MSGKSLWLMGSTGFLIAWFVWFGLFFTSNPFLDKWYGWLGVGNTSAFSTLSPEIQGNFFGLWLIITLFLLGVVIVSDVILFFCTKIDEGGE